MEVVCDASSILAVLLNEEEKSAMIEKTIGKTLIAPNCLQHEIGNALSALMKRKKLSVVDSVAVFHEYLKIPMKEIEIDIPYALILAGEDTMYAYDAYYMACCLRHNFPLLTLDKKLAHCATERGITCL